MRAVRALARGNSEIEFGFLSEGSKKCAYCTLMNEKCRPVPLYAGREYEELRAALDRRSAAEDGDEEELEVAEADVRSAAFRLGTNVQVATAQVSGLNVADLLVGAHYQQQEAREEMRALRTSVAELTGMVAQLVEAMGSRVAAAGPSGTRGGRGGGREGGQGQAVGRTGAAPSSAAGGLDGGERPTGVDDSELSDPPSDMEP
jgi:hypothetical protein